jgi:hypothetical protein
MTESAAATPPKLSRRTGLRTPRRPCAWIANGTKSYWLPFLPNPPDLRHFGRPSYRSGMQHTSMPLLFRKPYHDVSNGAVVRRQDDQDTTPMLTRSAAAAPPRGIAGAGSWAICCREAQDARQKPQLHGASADSGVILATPSHGPESGRPLYHRGIAGEGGE